MTGHILFADNDYDFLSTRTELLEREGFEVFKALSLSEAQWFLENANVHLALIDIRMENDDEERDISGLRFIAQEKYRYIPKAILTGHPNADTARISLKPQKNGSGFAVDYIKKEYPPDEFILAIRDIFTHNIRINWELAIKWKTRDNFSLVRDVESNLEGELLLNRAEEFEDLLRRLFYEKDHIRVERLLWQQNGRAALVVFAFKEEMKPESFVVVCGQSSVVNKEKQYFDEFAPKAPGETGTTLGEKMRAETTHFAANAYTLAGNDLETIQTLIELYHLNPVKTINAALSNLYEETLKAWHQEKPILNKGLSLDTPYRERLHLTNEFTQQQLEECISAIEIQIPTLGVRIERTRERLTIHFSGQPVTYPDPMPLLSLSQVIGEKRPMLLVTVPGTLSGENILSDKVGHTWLTDFAEAGLAPMLWNFVTLEAAIRFDWVDTRNLQRRHELERCLILTDFTRPDTRDLEPEVRKPARVIETIRKLASPAVGRDTLAYHLGIFFHAARRLADFDPAYPLTASELVRLGHILLSMAMIAEKLKLEESNEVPITPALVAEISIADEKARMVMIGDRKERLAPQPFEVFRYLYHHVNEVCSIEEILIGALRNKYDERYLHTLIGRIRKVIEDEPKLPRYLITEPNTGYRLISKPE